MKSAIAAVEIFGATPGGDTRRLTIAVGTPARAGEGGGWVCTVTIADVLPPTRIGGDDSFSALVRAVGRVRAHLAELQADGWRLYLDPTCERSMDFDTWLVPAG